MIRRLRILRPLAFLAPIAVAAVLGACASSMQKAERWAPYPGCNAGQCKTWYEECSAECINMRTMSVTECENRCRARVPDCESACG